MGCGLMIWCREEMGQPAQRQKSAAVARGLAWRVIHRWAGNVAGPVAFRGLVCGLVDCRAECHCEVGLEGALFEYLCLG